MNGKTIRVSLLFTLFFFQCLTLYSQYRVKGIVQNESTNSVAENIGVIAKLQNSDVIAGYSFTDNSGEFSLELENNGNYTVEFSSLKYISKTIEFIISNKDVALEPILLVEKTTTLDEVFITSEKAIKVRGDTIIFNVDKFNTGSEVVLEDILKNLPGLEVDGRGKISYNGKEIEKLMIEGDDFFEKGYRILSKNMPSHPVKEVQLLRNYVDNSLLKNIVETDDVAINIKLDEDAKRFWFGNIEANYSFIEKDRYHFRSSLMNFGKKNKYVALTNFNNIGYNAYGDIEAIISSSNAVTSDIGDNENVGALLNLSPQRIRYIEDRKNFNNAEMISLNAIFNPTSKIKIKTLGFFNWDETKFFRNSTNIVDFENTNFTNNQTYQLNNKKRIAFGKLDITNDISATKKLEATTSYNYGRFDDNSLLTFNETSTTEKLEHKRNYFDQKISYTNKFNDRQVLLLTGRFIDEKAPQNYKIDQFFFEELFPDNSNANNVVQQNTSSMQFGGFNAQFLDRNENGNLLEIQLGNEYRSDRLASTFSLLEDATIIDQPDDYQNQITYLVKNLYLLGKYRLKINDFDILGELNLHQFFNRLKYSQQAENQNRFFVNPGVGFKWTINDKNSISASYKFNTTNAEIVDVYNNYVLTSFRSFSSGTGAFNQLNASNVRFNYKHGGWSDRLFINTYLLYTKNHDFFSTNSLIQQNFIQVEKILIKDREFVSVGSKFDYYFKFITANLKLDLGYTTSEFKNIVSNSELRTVTSDSYNYGIELRSGFKSIFNYHIGTKWNTAIIKTSTTYDYTDNVSFLDLSFVFNDKFDIQLQSERYYFGNLETDNTYYFSDLEVRYKLKENKIVLGLTGKNLFNTERFRNFSVSDIGTSTIEYRLLPRFVLLKVEYRF